jgi:hypothetical protein
MATPEQPAHRKAVYEARTRARQDAAEFARDRRRKLSIMSGLGLSFILLGGSTGGYMARDGGGAGTAGPSVAIALAEPAPEAAPARGGAFRLALAETTGFQVALPPLAPTPAPEVPATESETQRLMLGSVLADLSSTAGNLALPSAAGEAALARLYEEPLETAAGPATGSRAAAAGATIQQAALPVPNLPDLDDVTQPAWQRFAVPVAAPGARPMIAVVLDDLGLNRSGTNRAIELPGPLTLAFMTYAEGLPRMTARARRAGHELMLHVPMAPAWAALRASSASTTTWAAASPPRARAWPRS